MRSRQLALFLLVAVSPLLSGCGLAGPAGPAITPPRVAVENPGPVLALEGRSINPAPAISLESASDRLDRIRLVDARGIERAIAVPDSSGDFRLVCLLKQEEAFFVERVDGKSGRVLASRYLGKVAPGARTVREVNLDEASTLDAMKVRAKNQGEVAALERSLPAERITLPALPAVGGNEIAENPLPNHVHLLFAALREEPARAGEFLAGGGFASPESLEHSIERIRQLAAKNTDFNERLRRAAGTSINWLNPENRAVFNGEVKTVRPVEPITLASVTFNNQVLFPQQDAVAIQDDSQSRPLFRLEFSQAGKLLPVTAGENLQILVRIVEETSVSRRVICLVHRVENRLLEELDTRIMPWTDIFLPPRFDTSGAMIWEGCDNATWEPENGARLTLELHLLEGMQQMENLEMVHFQSPTRFAILLPEKTPQLNSGPMLVWDFASDGADLVRDRSGHGLDLAWDGLVCGEEGADLSTTDFSGLPNAVASWDTATIPEISPDSMTVSTWFVSQVDIHRQARLADTFNPLDGHELPQGFPADPVWGDLLDALVAQRDQDPSAARYLDGLENLYDVNLTAGSRHHLAVTMDTGRQMIVHLDGRSLLQIDLALQEQLDAEQQTLITENSMEPTMIASDTSSSTGSGEMEYPFASGLPLWLESLRVDPRAWSAEEVASVWREGQDLYFAGSLDVQSM